MLILGKSEETIFDVSFPQFYKRCDINDEKESGSEEEKRAGKR